ncbi:MAG: T9SS type A sorting domain-containing protein [Chitinophagales bacterium]
MKKILLLVTLFLLTFSINIYAQNQESFECVFLNNNGSNGIPKTHYQCGTNANNFINNINGITDVDRLFYGNLNSWVPDNNTAIRTAPVKTIRLAFHIFQPTTPDPNYFLNTQVTVDFMNNVVAYINNTRYTCGWQSSCEPSDPVLAPTQELPNFDSKIMFDLGSPGEERIFFYQDDILNQSTISSTACFNHIAQNNPNFDIDAHLNVFWTQGTYMTSGGGAAGGLTGGESFSNLATRAFIFMFTNESHVSLASLAHELGHTLDLNHTYLGGGASAICDNNDVDYLSDIFSSPLSCPHVDANWDTFDAFSSPTDNVTNNLMGQWAGNHYISPMQAGKMHRALAFSNMRNYVDGCPYSNVPLEITKDETWSFDIRLYRDIIVRSGNTLTVTCSVRLPDNATVVVERGAKLILDGGSITNACEPDPANGITGMWGGIQVWGNAANPHWNGNGQPISPAELLATNASSYPQALTDHGVVVLTNGARLENAVTAISTKNANQDPSFHGGIVYAEDSEFLNNGRAVEFLQFGPGAYPFNASRFENCTFHVDQDYHRVGDYRFVTIWDVQWEQPDLNAVNPVFTFNDCLFESPFNPWDVANGKVAMTHRALYALHAEDAQFYVNSSRFIWMEIGVDAWGTPNLFRDVWVIGDNDLTNYDFHENLLGIHINGFFEADIHHTSFLGLTESSTNQLVSSGIYCFGDDLFDIYDNNFQNLHGGIFSARSQGLPNDIWGNTVRDGNFAISALGDNNGLLITCNDMDRMNFDIAVLNDGMFGSINPVQGGGPAPDGSADATIAGNLFSDFVTCPFPDTHVTNANNEDNAYFRYIFSTDNLRWVPRCITDQTFHPVFNLQSNIILPNEANSYNACNPNGGGGSPQGGLPMGFYNPCTDKPCLAEMATYINAEEQPLKDGDAQSLKDAINNAPTSAATKAALLNESPYLSDEVLTMVVNQTAMAENDAKDVLIANAPLSPSVWTAIDDRQPTFSSTTITAIQQAADPRSLSTRQVLQDWIATVAHKRNTALYDMLEGHVQTDNWTAALDLLQYETTDEAHQLSVRLHLANNDISSAANLLNVMHSNTLENTYFKDLQNLYIALQQNGKTYFDMTAAEETMVRNIANSNTKAAAKARSILTLVTGETFALFIPSLPNASSKHFNGIWESQQRLLTLQPNPNRGTTLLQLTEGLVGEQIEVVIYDLQGKQWQTHRFEPNQQKQWLTTNDLPEGMYICVLKVNGEQKEQVKMVVLK